MLLPIAAAEVIAVEILSVATDGVQLLLLALVTVIDVEVMCSNMELSDFDDVRCNVVSSST